MLVVPNVGVVQPCLPCLPLLVAPPAADIHIYHSALFYLWSRWILSKMGVTRRVSPRDVLQNSIDFQRTNSQIRCLVLTFTISPVHRSSF